MKRSSILKEFEGAATEIRMHCILADGEYAHGFNAGLEIAISIVESYALDRGLFQPPAGNEPEEVVARYESRRLGRGFK